ncbi:MAG: phospholipase D-like domain-containing protein [Acidobacteriota bacterium]|nr:phospholipase D-like domain-containing protein [Acidobacteriota bacterium]
MNVQIIVTIAVLLLTIAAVGFTYLTASVNAAADRADAIVSAPSVEKDADAFMRAFAGAAGQPVLGGNAIDLLQNGIEIFPALFDAIARARDSIHFSTFIYESGRVPRRFADAMSTAARRGIEVRIVLDSRGSKKIPPALITQMREAGCEVRWFRAVQWYNWTKYNHRTHRKLLIVDGNLAFTGGVGIADEWEGEGDSPPHWRDTHVRITGPAVAVVQAAFVDSWNEATGELPIENKHFPELVGVGDVKICAVQSNPAHATSAAQRSMAALIAGSSRRLWITNAYFVPTPPFLKTLCEAKARGVDVKILVPGPHHDQPAVRRASRRTWPALLRGSVELYEFQPTMIHAKTVIVDGAVSSIGSINFDPRSFALNAEFGVVVHDNGIAAQMESAFVADLGHARPITDEDIRRLSHWQNLLDSVCYWVRAQL